MTVRAILASLLTALLLLSGSAASACDLRCNLARHTAAPASRVDSTMPACHETAGMPAMQTAGHEARPQVAAHIEASPRLCGHMVCASPTLPTQPGGTANTDARTLAGTSSVELLPEHATLPPSTALRHQRQETPPPLLSPLALRTTLRL